MPGMAGLTAAMEDVDSEEFMNELQRYGKLLGMSDDVLHGRAENGLNKEAQGAAKATTSNGR